GRGGAFHVLRLFPRQSGRAPSRALVPRRLPGLARSYPRHAQSRDLWRRVAETADARRRSWRHRAMSPVPAANAFIEGGVGRDAQPYRLKTGGLIDRSRVLRARFDARVLTGFAGDTLASALLAAGYRLVARSFKYHRSRGIFSAGSEESNALVELRSGPRREAHVNATKTESCDGPGAGSQNRRPSLPCAWLAASSGLSPFLAEGLYYKTFMLPPSFWERVYEPLIRRAAGLGRAAGENDPD